MENEKLTARIELKIKQSTFDALKKIHEENKHSPQVVLRGLAEAVEEFFDKNGFFGFPIELSAKNKVQ